MATITHAQRDASGFTNLTFTLTPQEVEAHLVMVNDEWVINGDGLHEVTDYLNQLTGWN